ncbi:MAG: phenylalanine 4-monooxygenase [Bacteroidota bacterium]
MTQQYHLYTPEDHHVWSLLYDRQMELVPMYATSSYLEGIHKCGFRRDCVPDFIEVNRALAKATGWAIYVVPGLIDNATFFAHLSRCEFPATTWLRKLAQLSYLEEPDMFHDVFGHIPLLSEPFFCDFLQGLSEIMIDHMDDERAIERMARLYWYTVEFGLIREAGQIKIYGAGILSSAGETLYCVSVEANHMDYDPQVIMDTPYVKEGYQRQYFVISSYEELFGSLSKIREIIRTSGRSEMNVRNPSLAIALG